MSLDYLTNESQSVIASLKHYTFLLKASYDTKHSFRNNLKTMYIICVILVIEPLRTLIVAGYLEQACGSM